MISEKLLEILACPSCKGSLVFKNETLHCQECRRIYPVRNDIPVMLIEESWVEGENPPSAQTGKK